MTIDILPTVAKLVDAELPAHKIDGLDIWPLLSGEAGAKCPHEAFYFYYGDNQLQAVASGKWKLQLPHQYRTLAGKPGGTGGRPVPYETRRIQRAELYDLDNDIGETTDLAASYPDVVRSLEAFAEQARDDLGDSTSKLRRQGSAATRACRVNDCLSR